MLLNFQNRGIGDLQTTIIIIMVLVILWVVLRQTGRKRKKRGFRSTSLSNLRQRFIQGDISEEEYQKQKRDLENK